MASKLLLLVSILFLKIEVSSAQNNSLSPKKILMAVFAHADDETSIAPLLANYARNGFSVYLVIATNGAKGISAHAKIPAGDSLSTVREKELQCTAITLGIYEPIFLRLEDGSLASDLSKSNLQEKLNNLFNTYKPDAIITWGPDGGYGHTDHRMVHNIISEIHQSGKSNWQSKLYFVGIPSENKINNPSFTSPAINWLFNNWKTVKKAWLTIRIKCNEQDWQLAAQALSCHKSQFTNSEMNEAQKLFRSFNRDTIYLRPFSMHTKIKYKLF